METAVEEDAGEHIEMCRSLICFAYLNLFSPEDTENIPTDNYSYKCPACARSTLYSHVPFDNYPFDRCLSASCLIKNYFNGDAKNAAKNIKQMVQKVESRLLACPRKKEEWED